MAQQGNPVADSLKHKINSSTEQKKSLLNINEVILSGNKKTKSFIILRELPFIKGEWLTQNELDKRLVLAKQQLMNTTLFVDVVVYATTIPEKDSANNLVIHVDMKERWYLFPVPYFKLIDRNFNQWWVEQHRSLDRVNYGLKFIQNNFTGRNDNVDIWLITGYTQQITLRYGLPFFDKKLKSGISVGFIYATQKELNYATGNNEQLFFKQEQEVKKTVHFDATYSYRPNVKERHYLRLSYNREEVADTVIKLNPLFYPGIRTSIRYIDFNYQYKYYNVDYISYPTKGFLFEGNLYSRGINRDADLWQLSARAVYAVPLNAGSFLHFEAMGMVKSPNTDYFFNQRLLGYGYFQMRGLEYNVVDGMLGGALKSTVHQKLVSFVLKNPFPSKTHDKIPFRIFLKAYGDLGYGYMQHPIASNTLNNTLLRTWGFGMDIVSIYDFVFKIEYSFNQLGRDGLYLQSRNDF
jgi:outer membrane protein assembly factor BamA